LSNTTNEKIQSVRQTLSQLSQFQDPSRKIRQTALAKRLQRIVANLSQIQKEAKGKQQARLEREYRIARPDLNDLQIQQLVESGVPGQAFQVSNQQRVLTQVRERHEEMLQIEKSVEELAQLFTELQTMLMVFVID
jgi:t-SNARE complex subunit (syntaxin)